MNGQSMAGRHIFRLWHKVFLVSLVFVMAAVNITAVAISRSSFSASVERESLSAAERHSYISAAIVNNAAYRRLKSGKILLDRDECAEVIASVAKNGIVGDSMIAVYGENGTAVGDPPAYMPRIPSGLHNAATESETVSMIGDVGGGHFVFTASGMTLEGAEYSIYTCTDIGDVYRNYERQMDMAWVLSVVISSAVALVLLLSVWLMMRPIGRMNRALRRIAGGEYSLRLDVSGGAELSELSENINSMADSIEDSMDELRRVADGRKQFIDNFAHEMKTPLTSIMGFADILRIKKDVGVRQRREFAGIIVEETKRLRGLSGKLLELATAESVKLELAPVPAKEMFGEIYAAVFPIFAKNRMTLTVETDGTVLLADKELIKSLVYNLIDNAVKASSPEGEIRAGCRRISGGVVLYISDDGVGMDETHLRRVTEPFYMVDKSRSRSFGGAGLGLSLCDKIAKGHGGRLEIESSPGNGTTVRAVFGERTVYSNGEGGAAAK